MNIRNFHNIHLTGIGGISMSAIAQILHSKKHIITGTDDNASPIIDKLKNLGIHISTNHNPDFIKNADLVVFSSAISPSHPDLLLAQKLGKPTLDRAVFLGMLASNYHNTIAVSGTHGKTTTTAMLDCIFNTALLRPTTHIGGIMHHNSANYSLGTKKFFITEACEYNRNILHLHPNTAIITNIQAEHMDCYHDYNDLVNTFLQFTHQTQDLIILNGDTLDKSTFRPTKGQTLLTFGFEPHNTCYPANIISNAGKYIFDCIYQGKNLGQIRLNLYGQHNILNALACIIASIYYNIHFSTIQSALANFTGVNRRFDILATTPNTIIHDYAHHPTEIKNAITTALSINKGKLHTIFEPHTYSRTLTLMPEFSTAFCDTDYLYILPTYPSREMPLLGGDAIDLFYNVLSSTPNTTYCQHPEALFHTLDNIIQPNDTILFLGAGTIDTIAHRYHTRHNTPPTH